jgi:hypothetical protein
VILRGNSIVKIIRFSISRRGFERRGRGWMIEYKEKRKEMVEERGKKEDE